MYFKQKGVNQLGVENTKQEEEGETQERGDIRVLRNMMLPDLQTLFLSPDVLGLAKRTSWAHSDELRQLASSRAWEKSCIRHPHEPHRGFIVLLAHAREHPQSILG